MYMMYILYMLSILCFKYRLIKFYIKVIDYMVGLINVGLLIVISHIVFNE